MSEVRSYLGLINHYSRFLPNLSTNLAPLYGLLKKNSRFHWGESQRRAFQVLKDLLTSSKVLVHYDSEKDLILQCDASPYGLGAVLAHRMKNREEKPIAYASRSLVDAEKNYSQVEKEGLACVWAVKKFHKYLYGRPFTLCTDHKPLKVLFGDVKPIPAMAAARIQLWALTLSCYQYTLEHRPASQMCSADALGRLPLPTKPTEIPQPAETVFLLEDLENGLLFPEEVKICTDRDPVLSMVRRLLRMGGRIRWKESTVRTSEEDRRLVFSEVVCCGGRE